MRWLIIISILLSGCGEDVHLANPNGLWYQYESGPEVRFSEIAKAYSRAQKCTGLTATAPYVKSTAELPDGQYGFYDSDKSLVLIKEPSQDLMVHEFIHHLLYINTGNVDICHNSDLFNQCSTAGFIECQAIRHPVK